MLILVAFVLWKGKWHEVNLKQTAWLTRLEITEKLNSFDQLDKLNDSIKQTQPPTRNWLFRKGQVWAILGESHTATFLREDSSFHRNVKPYTNITPVWCDNTLLCVIRGSITFCSEMFVNWKLKICSIFYGERYWEIKCIFLYYVNISFIFIFTSFCSTNLNLLFSHSLINFTSNQSPFMEAGWVVGCLGVDGTLFVTFSVYKKIRFACVAIIRRKQIRAKKDIFERKLCELYFILSQLKWNLFSRKERCDWRNYTDFPFFSFYI